MNTNWFIIKRKQDKNSRNLFSIQFSKRKQTNVIVPSIILFTNILMFELLLLQVRHPRHSTELRIDPDPLRPFSGFVHSFTFNMFKLANMA